jgi:hypothetical protein
MAGTSLRRWRLLAAMSAAVFEIYGKYPDWITLRSAARYWQCPACKRIEKFLLPHWPVCSGTPENPHTARKAQRIRRSQGLVESDGPRRFK